MATGTVTNTVTLPDGTAPSNIYVKVELVASTSTPAASGYLTATGAQVEGLVELLSTNGTWSATLNTNASITPSGTYYRVTQIVWNASGHNVAYVDNISVSGSGTLASMLVSAPTDIPTSAASSQLQNLLKRSIKGLAAPFNGTARLMKQMPTMATPPTIVVTTNGGSFSSSSITSPATALITDPVFRLSANGGIGPSPGHSPFWTATALQPDNQFGQLIINFMFSGREFEYMFRANGLTFRIMVDGEYISTTPTNQGALDLWATAYVNFGSRDVRQITIETGTNQPYAIRFGPNDSIWYPNHLPAQPRVILVCDSFGRQTAAGPPTVFDCWWGWAARRLGWDIWASACSGAGYLAPGSFGGTIRTRVNQLASWQPDVWILASGINDTGSTASAITAEAAATFVAAKAGAPQAKLLVVGPFGSGTTTDAPRLAVRDAILAAVNAAGSGVDAFIDPLALGFITGSGRVGATTGTGNADVFIGSDGVHPSTAGHRYLGDRMANQFETVIDTLTLV